MDIIVDMNQLQYSLKKLPMEVETYNWKLQVVRNHYRNVKWFQSPDIEVLDEFVKWARNLFLEQILC